MARELSVVVKHEQGLHARPAAAFVQAAAGYRASVQVRNVSAGRGPAPARSILAILGLGVRQGQEVLLSAEGDDADEALRALSRLLERE